MTDISILELAECAGITEVEIRELIEYGALSPTGTQSGAWMFRSECMVRVRKAVRLRNDLELDQPTVALLLTYLERIDDLEARVRDLSAQLQAPQRR